MRPYLSRLTSLMETAPSTVTAVVEEPPSSPDTPEPAPRTIDPEAIEWATARLATLPRVQGDYEAVRAADLFSHPLARILVGGNAINPKTTSRVREELEIARLEPTQELVPVEGLTKYIAKPRKDPIDVLRLTDGDRDRYVVQEGHTRAGAAALRGESTIAATVWQLVKDARGIYVGTPRGLHARGLAKRDLTHRERLAVMLDWDEEKHPRDENGRFAAGHGVSVQDGFVGSRPPDPWPEAKQLLSYSLPDGGGEMYVADGLVPGFMNVAKVDVQREGVGDGFKLYAAALRDVQARGYKGLASEKEYRTTKAIQFWDSLKAHGAEIEDTGSHLLLKSLGSGKTRDLTHRERLALLLDWDEELHPRDEKGQFAPKAGSQGVEIVDTSHPLSIAELPQAQEAVNFVQAAVKDSGLSLKVSIRKTADSAGTSFGPEARLGGEYLPKSATVEMGADGLDEPDFARTVVHEMGHALEDQNPELIKAAQEFLAERKAAVPPDVWEKASKGSRFVGAMKRSTVGLITDYAMQSYEGWTEVISTGLEAMFVDPAGFQQKAPAHFEFIQSILKKKDLTHRERLALLLDWDEDQHPRDDKGQFATKADVSEVRQRVAKLKPDDIKQAHEMLRVPTPGTLTMTHAPGELDRDPTQSPDVKTAAAFVASITNRDFSASMLAKTSDTIGVLATYDPATNVIALPYTEQMGFFYPPEADAIVHEFGHAMEYSDPSIRESAHAFLRERLETKAGKTAAAKGAKGEYRHVKGSGFITNYATHVYPDGGSELLSVGIEHLYKDPVGFARKAPEHFEWTLRQLQR